MKQRLLLAISVPVTRESEEAVIGLLTRSCGQSPAIYKNELAGKTTATIYLERRSAWNPAMQARLRLGLARLRGAGLGPGSTRIRIAEIPRENWAESWKRHFKPLRIGARLLVKPSWSRREPLRGQAVAIIDPGLSFGTGQHPTTYFCLEQLVRYRQPGTAQSLFDVGTGSGILAISAAKLGFSPVDAIDVDPEAIRVGRRNARANQVATQVKIVEMDLVRLPFGSTERYDVICANLVCDLLLSESRRLVCRLKEHGALVLAGILRKEFRRVRQFYEQMGLKLVLTRVNDEWQAGAFELRRSL